MAARNSVSPDPSRDRGPAAARARATGLCHTGLCAAYASVPATAFCCCPDTSSVFPYRLCSRSGPNGHRLPGAGNSAAPYSDPHCNLDPTAPGLTAMKDPNPEACDPDLGDKDLDSADCVHPIHSDRCKGSDC